MDIASHTDLTQGKDGEPTARADNCYAREPLEQVDLKAAGLRVSTTTHPASRLGTAMAITLVFVTGGFVSYLLYVMSAPVWSILSIVVLPCLIWIITTRHSDGSASHRHP